MKPKDLCRVLTPRECRLHDSMGNAGPRTPAPLRIPKDAHVQHSWSGFCVGWVAIACAALGLYDSLI